ncbi:PREDICTED: uncharacterized protein At1g76660-like [Lupinus angustifolius]|uniref:uncharacterized protein At1g76660-like n=1 Tax=Lupinus angustifolius TaxID=3871 RepID=UPI00092E74CF|nr:PREDICTED: uncharacterized protein At1g76660-like [Lupinus angustifolius]
MGSEQNRFPQQHERRKRWGGCLGAFSCFGSQKGGGKRIVPASRIPENNGSAAQPNGPQVVGLANQVTGVAPSLLAPPSSPASFTQSPLPSTAQSPNSYLSLSANSPGGPSSSMFATGPYAHETQLVSPPVFSNFTTEPSTAPLTPPPELAHLTTPSSPDVPYARFLSLSLENGKYGRTGSGRLSGHDTNGGTIASQDTNFFCPATYAQFYLEQNPFPHNGGRLSVSKDSDVQSTGGNGHQNWHARSPKQDVEEIEAYRASFGFSADEVFTTTQYVEISDVNEDSFTILPSTAGKTIMEENIEPSLMKEGFKAQEMQMVFPTLKSLRLDPGHAGGKEAHNQVSVCQGYEDHKSQGHYSNSSGLSTPTLTDEEDIFSKMGPSRSCKKYKTGLSCSDAEVEYRRGRSLRERKGNVIWHD